MEMKFTKWQGCGNDFVLVDCLDNSLNRDYASFGKELCDRHYGIGADGILVVEPSKKADFRMRIINADGSEAEMCGNGIRCFARYLYDFGRTSKTEFTIETGAGILVPALELENNKVTGVRVDMGEPVLEGDDIPVKGFGKNKVVDELLTVNGQRYNMTCVSMGNPHCVIFVDDTDNFPIEKLGSFFEHHEAFPRKTNTEFVTVRDKNHMRMRVWERGAAVTLACGTGSCASLVAAVLTGRTERNAEIELDGGTLQVEWAYNNHLFMTGPAELVFTGNLDI